ncbi:MAG: cadherin repeat domain-containing protein [Cyclobacteriaceae bacterium]|nr:cadherin repeat domain-containing protein [Cyclobacteriaceae bacterium]
MKNTFTNNLLLVTILLASIGILTSCEPDELGPNDPQQDESTNDGPTVSAQTFSIAENSLAGTVVGTISASDADGDALQFSLTGGNAGDAFALDATSGELTVKTSTALDYETTPGFSLTVEVSDGKTALSATITINLTDVDESTSCRILTTEFPGDGTLKYIYDENDCVTTLELLNPDGSLSDQVDVTCVNNKIAGIPSESFSIVYDGDLVNKIVWGTTETRFFYTDSILSKIEGSYFDDFLGQTIITTYDIIMTNGNVSRITQSSSYFTKKFYINYEYDSNPNPHYMDWAAFVLIEDDWEDVLSVNNLIKLEETSSDNLGNYIENIAYQYNDQGLPSSKATQIIYEDGSIGEQNEVISYTCN